MLNPPIITFANGGGGGGRITEEAKIREVLEIMLAIWLKDKLRELNAVAGPLLKYSRLWDTVMFKDVVLEILVNSLEEIRQEFRDANKDSTSVKFCKEKQG